MCSGTETRGRNEVTRTLASGNLPQSCTAFPWRLEMKNEEPQSIYSYNQMNGIGPMSTQCVKPCHARWHW